MAKYSKPYKLDSKLYRYNYDRCTVEYISKPEADMIADNEEWQQKYHRNLWDIIDGYLVIESVGLMTENWTNRESRDEYLSTWSDELDEEFAYLAAQYLAHG